MNVNERKADYHYLWVAYTPNVAVLWEVRTSPNGEPGRTMLALHVYGAVDSQNARKIPHNLIASANPADHPRWQVAPPRFDTIQRRDVYELLPLQAGGDPMPGDGRIIDWSEAPTPTRRQVAEAWDTFAPSPEDTDVTIGPRAPGEPVEQFYARVADAYRLHAARTGKPTSALAASAGVSKQTAARWVHEARRRGHLEPTTKGRINR